MRGKIDVMFMAEEARIERQLRHSAMEFASKNVVVGESSKAIVTDAEAYLKFLRGKK